MGATIAETPSEKSIADSKEENQPGEVIATEFNKDDPESALQPLKKYPETDLSRGIVGWDGQDDPHNPQNFEASRKWGLLALTSAITFVSPLASSMFSPSVSYVAVDLGVTNETLLSFSISIYILGYAVSLTTDIQGTGTNLESYNSSVHWHWHP
jgi:hypothetical protein